MYCDEWKKFQKELADYQGQKCNKAHPRDETEMMIYLNLGKNPTGKQ